MNCVRPLSCVLVTTLFLTTQLHAQSFLTNGLVAYYPFNGNANDASGHGYDGTVHGAVLTVDKFGISNQAYSFNGTNNFIGIPEPLFGSTTPGCTFSAWITIKSGPWTNNQEIVLYKSTQNGEAQMGVESGNAHFGPKLAASQSFFFAEAPMVFDKPTHVVGTYSQGQQVELYLNGVLANSTNVPSDNLYVNASLPLASSLGIYDYTPSPYLAFRGTIEDVRIYNRALSTQEVQQLYQYESPPLQIGLIKAVKPFFSNLYVGTNYQLQVSGDLSSWTDQGSPFTATNSSMAYPEYWDVDNWNRLFFRVRVVQ